MHQELISFPKWHTHFGGVFLGWGLFCFLFWLMPQIPNAQLWVNNDYISCSEVCRGGWMYMYHLFASVCLSPVCPDGVFWCKNKNCNHTWSEWAVTCIVIFQVRWKVMFCCHRYIYQYMPLKEVKKGQRNLKKLLYAGFVLLYKDYWQKHEAWYIIQSTSCECHIRMKQDIRSQIKVWVRVQDA